MKLNRAIRWHNRLLDATTLSLIAGMVFAAFATTFNPVVGLCVIGSAGILAGAGSITTPAVSDQPAASDRGSEMCKKFSTLAGLRVPQYVESHIDNGLGHNDNERIVIDQRFSASAPTSQLGAVIGHEIGHSLYGHTSSVMNRMLTIAPLLGLSAVILASPWLGLAGALLGLGAMAGAAVSGFLLTQMQQRQEEYACDRVAVILAGSRAMGDALTSRTNYMPKPKLIRRLQAECKPDSLAEKVLNLFDTHPPVHRRERAMISFAHQLGTGHDACAEKSLEATFGKLARHKPDPAPHAPLFRFNYRYPS